MKNKLITLILTGVFCLLLCLPVFADKSYIHDSTGRFTAEEIEAFNTRAEQIIEEYDIAPYFVVVNDAGGKTEVQYTEDFYEEHASGTNCLIMLLTTDMYYVLPIGTAVDVFEYQEDTLYDAFYGKIYNGDTYPAGALAYLDEVESIILDYKNAQSAPQTEVDKKAGTRVVDNAELIEPIQENTVSMKLDEMSTKYQCDVVFVTIPSTYGTGVTAFADNYFDYNGYGFGSDYDGILFLISMEEREWAFSTCGNAMNIFNDDVLVYMEDIIIPYLRKNDFESAANQYATMCETFLESAENGEIFNEDTLPKVPYNPTNIIFAVILGLVIAIIVVVILRGQLKSVKKKTGANDYMKSGSLKLTKSHERFLYSHVTKRVKPQSSSSGGSHRSSSGRSHGGRSGRF